MTYKLFIDDERHPPSPTTDWMVARTSNEAEILVHLWGMPKFISFDHDLGANDTAMRFICWMVDELLDERLTMPKGFEFYVHSQNPVGAANIQSLMESIVREFS